jgi:hypothetical protein
MFHLQVIGPNEKVQWVEILDGRLSGPEIWTRVTAWAQLCESHAGMRIHVRDENGGLLVRTGVEAVLFASRKTGSLACEAGRVAP